MYNFTKSFILIFGPQFNPLFWKVKADLRLS